MIKSFFTPIWFSWQCTYSSQPPNFGIQVNLRARKILYYALSKLMSMVVVCGLYLNCLYDLKYSSQFHCISDLEKQVAVAKNSLEKDNVIAVPTDTIYGIAAYAQSTDSINRIYDIKKRNYNKPIAICVGEVDDVYRYCFVLLNIYLDMYIDDYTKKMVGYRWDKTRDAWGKCERISKLILRWKIWKDR